MADESPPRPFLALAIDVYVRREILDENFTPAFGPWQGQSCPMCLETYQTGETVNICRNGHYFHGHCFRTSLETAVDSFNCGICRTNIFSERVQSAVMEEMMDLGLPTSYGEIDEDDTEADTEAGTDPSDPDINGINESWEAWARSSSDRGLENLGRCESYWQSHFVDFEDDELVPTGERMADNDMLNYNGDPFDYVKPLGMQLTIRVDELMPERHYEENSPFGEFCRRVKIAVFMLGMERRFMVDEPTHSLAPETEYCERMIQLHEELALCLGDAEIENGQQLLHQGTCILAAAHQGPYIPATVRIELENFDYRPYGGALAASLAYVHWRAAELQAKFAS